MNATTSYILSRKYTQETAIQFGALKGAPCKIKSTEKVNGQTIIIFEWKNDDGEVRTSQIAINDGTPIYVWESNSSYEYGDIVIFANNFYRCTAPNHDLVFDSTHWSEIGSADGNYDIVESASYLPPRFTAADRKLYYSIEDWCFWLWNGEGWVKQTKKANYNTLGLVMVDEETLNIDENGKLSIRTITSEEVGNLF